MEEFRKEMAETVNRLTGLINVPDSIVEHLSKDKSFVLSVYHAKFRGLKSNLERMKFVYADIERCQIDIPFKKDGKDDNLAMNKRETGNVQYKLGKYQEALQMYTESLMVAESKEMLSLAYANRSAALYHLKLFEESVEEIDRAFENGYPEDLKPKLIIRRKNCLLFNNQREKLYEPEPQIPSSEKNPCIANAKNCVKIMKNKKYGRHVIATKTIEVGEVIAVEPVYTGFIHEKFMYLYCHHCFHLSYNLIPCNTCSKTLYCSDICKYKASSSYHKYECPLLLSLDLVQIDVPKRLALRITLMARDEWKDGEGTSDGTYRSDRFKEIIELKTHEEKRSVENLFARTAIACHIYCLVKKHTNFIEDVDEDHFMDILLSVLLITGTNTVAINELSPVTPEEYDLKRLATAIYPFFTMFSHSCCPNLFRTYHGSVMVLRSNSTINKGEQCFVEYGPNYLFYPKEFRQNFLRDHQFFTCTCEACEQDWPINEGIRLSIGLQLHRLFILKELESADVKVAEKWLPKILEFIKTSETSLRPAQLYAIKGLLGCCCDVFGNKRRI